MNRRVFSELDVLCICEESGVEIKEVDIDQEGFYLKVQGKSTIYVNRKLGGTRWLYVILHELAHHLLHASNYQNAAFFFLKQQDSKQHHEAEAFALLAMLPEPFLRRLLAGDLLSELEDYPKELVLKRLRLLDIYGV
ncbi:MAG: ImmA/IrrE family metallo-endopeptidase [Acidobacteria bacterium]|nr:ImmA/IrrE family metallo-endopeptidase [Acidobacteriota bacterium]